MLDRAPTFDVAGAERLAREHFAFDGKATPLTSERDQNFRIERADGSRIVLKIANADEAHAMLLAQHAALAHAAQTIDTTPRVLRAVDGTSLVDVIGDDGTHHQLWAITWLPGRARAPPPRRAGGVL
jgi:Ser/Thr protein kinase RdoA (MazF antagonist)